MEYLIIISIYGKVPRRFVELIDKFLSNLEIDNNFID
jgi:hypothetical protein